MVQISKLNILCGHTHTQEGMKKFITPIIRFSGESKPGAKASPKVDWKYGGFGVSLWLGSRAGVRVPLCMWDLCD